MKLLIKNVDNDGRLALIPEFLETSWMIDVANAEDRKELERKLADADAMISMNWARTMPLAPKLKLLQWRDDFHFGDLG